ncbi:MAG: hypothetical protein GX754_02595 [Clostridiaceae bacterium]|nr:hypothetical protein [Clostridiaceae bacterium]
MESEISSMQEGYSRRNLKDGFFVEYIRIPQLTPPGYVMTSKHYHDYYEVYYLIIGEASYIIEDNIFNLRQYGMVFINKNVFHKTQYNEKGIKERILY